MGLNTGVVRSTDSAFTDPGITAPALPAHSELWERRLLADPNLLSDIAFALDGPFHVLYPGRVEEIVGQFRAAFEAAEVNGSIYFGKKANKAGCVARACAESGAGVDVSSVGELNAALAQGIRGEDLLITGPAKHPDLLWLAARHGALITVDCPAEWERLAENAIPSRVLARVRPPGSDSRFGMTDDELDRILAHAPGGPVRLDGFSFHLGDYDPIARADLALATLERIRLARVLGHPATVLSIGGGFGVDYVPAGPWREFVDGVGPHWFHAGKTFEFYYPYHYPGGGAEMLTTILRHQDLARQLRADGVRLAIEPGRALLDRAGSTVFRVQGVKTRSAQGKSYQLLTVDGSSLSLSEQWFDSEYLPDPVLWPQRPGTRTPMAVGGATCLETDMLSWRRIPAPRAAVPGDLLIYPNTAGYQMDSNESAFHELPIPPKVVLHDSPEGRLRWRLEPH